MKPIDTVVQEEGTDGEQRAPETAAEEAQRKATTDKLSKLFGFVKQATRIDKQSQMMPGGDPARTLSSNSFQSDACFDKFGKKIDASQATNQGMIKQTQIRHLFQVNVEKMLSEARTKKDLDVLGEGQAAGQFVAFLKLPPAHRQERSIDLFSTYYLQKIKYFQDLNLSMAQYRRILTCMTCETFQAGDKVFEYG